VGRVAGGTIINGRHCPTTQDPDNGALAGKHKFSVLAKEADVSSLVLKSKKAGDRSLSNDEKVGSSFR
jgi:hypothetical protein